MLNFYRRCIPNAALLQAPLHDMIRGHTKGSKKPLIWTPESDSAFDQSKKSIVDAVKPGFLSRTAPLILRTDASASAIGAALEQVEEGFPRPIGFFSRKLSDTETRYSTYDRELLAIFVAIKNFQRF